MAIKPANFSRSIPLPRNPMPVGQPVGPMAVGNPAGPLGIHPLQQHVANPYLRRRFMTGYIKGVLAAHQMKKSQGSSGGGIIG